MWLTFIVLVITGCATNKGVTYIEQFNRGSKAIIILKDPPTRESVLPVLVKWFSDNGFSATVVESLSEVNPGDLIFSYRAWWGWDLALYMRRVEMHIKSKGETLGSINFDALQYGTWGKFGDGEQRLRILLDALFGKITREEADKLLGEV
jgi:hypothetical protein